MEEKMQYVKQEKDMHEQESKSKVQQQESMQRTLQKEKDDLDRQVGNKNAENKEL